METTMTQPPTKRRNGAGSLIFGIVFTVLGGGLLIERTTGYHVFDSIWRLWPVLLIILGLKYIADNRPPQSAEKEA